jgi:hypothetical protein
MVALVPVDLHEADAYRRRQDHSTDREVLHAAHVCQQASGLDACRRRKLLIICARCLTKIVSGRRLFTALGSSTRVVLRRGSLKRAELALNR